ncbi:MAG: ATP synthase F1 subunit gamma [Tyzzerella sp.]|nr:ATP synthase F1 subunit gamma [Tyzzerella sp.]
METSREIQTRIKSIQDTMKITNAMYMISSAKLRKARKSLEDTKPYFQMLQGTIARIIRHLPEMEHRYFEQSESNVQDGVPKADEESTIDIEDLNGKQQKKRGFIVVSADKGLAGAYNHNVLKLTEECLKKGQDNLLFVVGELGREYFIQHKIPMYTEFRYTVQDPDLTRARDISDFAVSLYDEGKLDELYMIYTYEENSMKVEAKVCRLLPLKKEVLATSMLSGAYAEDIRMIPSAESVLENVVPDYVTGFIYGALVESFCSEQNSRMMAMQAATDNAEKILKELRIQFNRVRQGAITQEITEVIAGAKAQKKRRRKA